MHECKFTWSILIYLRCGKRCGCSLVGSKLKVNLCIVIDSSAVYYVKKWKNEAVPAINLNKITKF
jgi:hypothetical protein